MTDKFKNLLLFSYNLKINEINRDRNHVEREVLQKFIKNAIEETKSKEVIKIILESAEKKSKSLSEIEQNGDFFEFQPMEYKFPRIWKEMFYEIFGENAILATGRTTQGQIQDAKDIGYKPIFLNSNVASSLKKT